MSESTIEDLQNDNASLAADLQSAREQLEQLRKHQSTLEAENKQLQADFKVTQESNLNLQFQLNRVCNDRTKELEEEVRALNTERRSDQAQIKALTAQNEEHLTDKESLIDEISTLRKQLDGPVDELRALAEASVQGDIDGVRAERDRFEDLMNTAHDDRDRFKAALDEQRSQNAELHEQLAAATKKGNITLQQDGYRSFSIAWPAMNRGIQGALSEAQALHLLAALLPEDDDE